MRPLRLFGPDLGAADVEGRVLTHDLGPDLRKGTVLSAAHLDRLRSAGEVHVVELEPGDVHEDVASARLARALLGDHLEASAPHQSQVRIRATARGLVRVDPAAVEACNQLPGIAVFTVYDDQAVNAGDDVAGCKVTPVAIAESVLAEAEALCRARPVIRLLPFRPLRTLLVVTERLKPKAREIFQAAVSRKLGWYGAEVVDTLEVARSREAVAEAYASARKARADLILFAGASSIDPLDPAYSELSAEGGELIRFGMPAHPGSMLWLGRLSGKPVVGIASCAGFGKQTSLDLVLPVVFAYGDIDSRGLARLGYGGLIEESAGRRFPPYNDRAI